MRRMGPIRYILEPGHHSQHHNRLWLFWQTVQSIGSSAESNPQAAVPFKPTKPRKACIWISHPHGAIYAWSVGWRFRKHLISTAFWNSSSKMPSRRLLRSPGKVKSYSSSVGISSVIFLLTCSVSFTCCISLLLLAITSKWGACTRASALGLFGDSLEESIVWALSSSGAE